MFKTQNCPVLLSPKRPFIEAKLQKSTPISKISLENTSHLMQSHSHADDFTQAMRFKAVSAKNHPV